MELTMYFDLSKLYEKYKILKKGVIHIGAHEGQECSIYLAMNIPEIVLFEANPDVYQRLVEKIQSTGNIKAVQCAISNYVGECKFHVTSMDQSSSILPLKYHKVVYPNIVETKIITVPCITLDTFFKIRAPSNFNFINIDIQGAELLAFQGAINLLENHIDAINTEVNYEEMYEGCVLKTQLDKFLAQFNFVCREEKRVCSSWGDAFYVKEKI
jgi:FkbM family methyltransferase